MAEPGPPIDKRLVTLKPPTTCTHPKTILCFFWLSTMLCVGLGWSYYYIVLRWWWIIFLLPFEMLAIGYAFIMSSFLLVKIAISRLERRSPPREGWFQKDSQDMKDYMARHFFKYYALWLARNATFPWIDKIAYTMFGVKVGKTVVLHEAWVDTELVDIDDYAMVGMGSSVMSHCLYKDHVLVKKVMIDAQTVVGAFTILAPGVHVGYGSVLGANSGTLLDQHIEPRFLYAGNPARKLKEV